MIGALAETQSVAADGAQEIPLAPWGIRAAAFCADVLPGIAITMAFGLTAMTVPFHGAWWWLCVSVCAAAVLATAVNRLVLPGSAGQTIGRAVFGIAVLGDDGRPLSPVRVVMRELAHVLDSAPALLGWLWPLWDSRNRTFADMLSHSDSRARSTVWTRAGIRRLSTAVVALSAVLCLGAAALSYGVVGRHDRAVAAARSEIAAAGPGLVEQILTYHPGSLQADFDHAQSLVTDNYRAELSAEQEAVRKAGKLSTEYWVANSAVVSADEAAATLLLFLQGKTGIGDDRRFITAPVRAMFVKSGRDWRLDGLTAVTEPLKASTR